MSQLILDYLFIIILPFLVGVMLRLVADRTRKPFIVTICLSVLAVLMWILSAVMSKSGSDTGSIKALMTSFSVIGSIAVGLLIRILRR